MPLLSPFLHPVPHRLSPGWDLPPTVVECSGSDFPSDEVRAAVQWWSDRGYRFLGLRQAPCFGPPPRGELWIDRMSSDAPCLSVDDPVACTTDVLDSTDRTIRSAWVRVLVDGPRVLVHELGHALGWADFNVAGHVMDHDVEAGGWGDAGLRVVP